MPYHIAYGVRFATASTSYMKAVEVKSRAFATSTLRVVEFIIQKWVIEPFNFFYYYTHSLII